MCCFAIVSLCFLFGIANVEQLATLLYWGGEIIKHGDMGSVDYSEPPKTMCFLSLSSSYDELVAKVHTTMVTNADNTKLVLLGRYPTIIPGGQTVFVHVPLNDNQTWKWFLQVASLSQPIHVYAIAGRRTDGESTSQGAPLLSRADPHLNCNDVNSEEWKQRRLKVILDQLTLQNLEWVLEQLMAVTIDNAVTLVGLISQLFNKAVMEPAFSWMFADICYRLNCMLPALSVNNEKVTFKMLLLNHIKEEFERGEADRKFASEQKKMIRTRRMLVNIKLMGELYRKQMLTERVIHERIKKLLGHYENPDEENIEGFCHLMDTVGETIDQPKAKEHMDLYFETMLNLINHPTLSLRLKEMLMNLVDLRINKWQKIGNVKGSERFPAFRYRKQQCTG